MGKNLSPAPFLLGLAGLLVVLLQFVYPMRPDHFIAVLLQLIPMLTVFLLVSNLLPMFAPMPIRPGSLKPASPRGIMILVNLAFLPLFPLAMATTLLPLGIEFMLARSGPYRWFPAFLVFTLAEVALIAVLYPRVLDWQGELLQDRERRILEVVTSRIG